MNHGILSDIAGASWELSWDDALCGVALQPLEPTGCELMQLVGSSWFCKKGFLIYPLWQQLPCSHIGCPVTEHTLEGQHGASRGDGLMSWEFLLVVLVA